MPRKALTAVYEALVAAAAFFALRNRYADGFHFDTAAAMYQAYETELYTFDQRYRQCCTAADTVESQNWDVLKTLRAQVEAVYVHWYLASHPGLGYLRRPCGAYESLAALAHRPGAESAPVLPATCQTPPG